MEHPITPPPELIGKWIEDWDHSKVKHIELEDHIATEAARWGADQELEKCCEWLEKEREHLGWAYRLNPKTIRAALATPPPEPPTGQIIFNAPPPEEVIRLDKEGFHYKGQFIADAGEAYRLLLLFLKQNTKDEDDDRWPHL